MSRQIDESRLADANEVIDGMSKSDLREALKEVTRIALTFTENIEIVDQLREHLDGLGLELMSVSEMHPDCRECGNPCFVTPDGVSHHYDEDTHEHIDHDADGDHTAIPDTGEAI